MAILRSDEAELEGTLERLPWPLRVAFAAACAERLLPAYLAFSTQTGRGEPATLQSILAQLWDDLTGRRRMTDNGVRARIDAWMKLIPQEDDGAWVMEQASAEDAAAAATYALRCRQNGQAQEAVWSARRACEALDHYVTNRENIDLNATGAEVRVLAHPLAQAELARQRRDPDELLGARDADIRDVAARLRDRAKKDAAIFFGPAL